MDLDQNSLVAHVNVYLFRQMVKTCTLFIYRLSVGFIFRIFLVRLDIP